jgi:hypothetical protein
MGFGVTLERSGASPLDHVLEGALAALTADARLSETKFGHGEMVAESTGRSVPFNSGAESDGVGPVATTIG